MSSTASACNHLTPIPSFLPTSAPSFLPYFPFLSLPHFFTIGTASCWFLLDVVFYANGLFNHDVTSLVLSNGQPTTALQDAFNSAFICIVGTHCTAMHCPVLHSSVQ